MTGKGCRGSHLDASGLISAIAQNAEQSRGTAGQAAIVLSELKDAATQANVTSRASVPLLSGTREDGLRNRLFLKYIGVEFEYFSSGDHVYRR